jgi:hypothetical protein
MAGIGSFAAAATVITLAAAPAALCIGQLDFIPSQELHSAENGNLSLGDG